MFILIRKFILKIRFCKPQMISKTQARTRKRKTCKLNLSGNPHPRKGTVHKTKKVMLRQKKDGSILRTETILERKEADGKMR